MHKIMARKEIIFVLGSSFSNRLLVDFIVRIKQQEWMYRELLHFIRLPSAVTFSYVIEYLAGSRLVA